MRTAGPKLKFEPRNNFAPVCGGIIEEFRVIIEEFRVIIEACRGVSNEV